MASAAAPRDVVCFNVVLADLGTWWRTTALLSAMRRGRSCPAAWPGPRPGDLAADATSFTHAVKSHAAAGHWPGAVALLGDLARQHLQLDAFLCSALLKAERWQLALRLRGLPIRRDAVCAWVAEL